MAAMNVCAATAPDASSTGKAGCAAPSWLPPFPGVGHEALWAQLRADAEQGRLRAILWGAPGTGKTMALRWLARATRAAGARVVMVDAESERRPVETILQEATQQVLVQAQVQGPGGRDAPPPQDSTPRPAPAVIVHGVECLPPHAQAQMADCIRDWTDVAPVNILMETGDETRVRDTLLSHCDLLRVPSLPRPVMQALWAELVKGRRSRAPRAPRAAVDSGDARQLHHAHALLECGWRCVKRAEYGEMGDVEFTLAAHALFNGDATLAGADGGRGGSHNAGVSGAASS